MNVIEARDVAFRYGSHAVLDGISLSVDQGQVFGFIGPNGAGKSTFIKSLLGLLFPSSGTLKIHGGPPSDPLVRRHIGFLPEQASYYRFLTPMETLLFYGDLCGLDRRMARERSRALLARLGLEAVKDKRISKFSKGMAQKVGIAQALLHDPDTLILDEPMSGLDPLARQELRDLLVELKQKGKTIFFSSHELSEIELFCDSIAMIRAGRVVVQGPLSQVLAGSEHSLEKLFLRLIREPNP